MKIASLLRKISVTATGAVAGLLLATSAHAGLDDLRGAWINVDDSTRGITSKWLALSASTCAHNGR